MKVFSNFRVGDHTRFSGNSAFPIGDLEGSVNRLGFILRIR